MEQILANVGGKTRRATLHGREYLVAPATMIVPGVLPGSKGPLLYPADEVTRDPQVWNGIPLVLNHPTLNGEQVSARDPEVLDRFGLGMVLRSRADSGSLKAEAWFDVQQTKKLSPVLWNRLQTGQPIELSTGLFTDEELSEGIHNGTEYRAIARNYRPDHLAILLDNAGACSVRDGCGVLVNAEEDDGITWITISGNPVPIKDGTIQAGPFKGKEYTGDSRSDPKDPNAPRFHPRSSDERSKLAVELSRLRTAAEDLQDVGRVFTGHGNLRENGPVGGLARLGAGAIKAGVKVGGKAFELLFRGVSKLNEKLGVNEWTENADSEGMELIKQALAMCDTPEKYKRLIDAIEAAYAHEDEEAPTENERSLFQRFLGWLTNAGLYGNPQSTATGKFKHYGAGIGKGDAHEAAQRGALTLTERDRELGERASMELAVDGAALPAWVEDGAKWERAKEAADKGDYDGVTYWSAVAAIYQRLGGGVRAAGEATTNNGAETEDSEMAMTQQQRGEHVKYLITNCDCWKKATPADKETLNKLSDEQLATLRQSTEEAIEARATLNVLRKDLRVPASLTVNEMPAFIKEKIEAKEEEEDEEKTENMEDCEEGDEDCEATMNKGKKATANKKHTPITERLSPEELQVWNNVVRADKRERQRLTSQLQKIAETTGDPRRKALIANKLKGNLPVGDLEELLVLVSPVANSRREESAVDNSGPLYFGNNPAYGLTENEQSQVLDIEEARKSYDPVLTKRRRQYADA